MISVDLNCDMGEGMDNDALLMPWITSANISCGFHAGDEGTMISAIELAGKYNVAIGAHPGYADKPNFGREEKNCSPAEIYNLVFEQVAIMKAICTKLKLPLQHVKPHGALYNQAAKNTGIANAIAMAVYKIDRDLILYGLSGSTLLNEAKKVGVTTRSEVFADRSYQPDGSLTSRSNGDALITDADQSIRQVLQMIQHHQVTCTNGTIIPILAETVCLHGDGAHAVEFAIAINKKLRDHSIEIKTH